MGISMFIRASKNPLKIDCHTHILPGMDDGAQDVQQAVEMLALSHKYGVQTLLLTPHYCVSAETPADFLQRRDAALHELQSAYTEDLPRLIAGAEVRLEKKLSAAVDVQKLCIGDSAYMLLEMPYAPLDNWMIEEIEAICFERGCKPIFAHLPRYAGYYSEEDFAELCTFPDALVQVNAEDMLFKPARKRVRKWIERGVPVVFGSDCHNMTDRCPNLDVAERHIAKAVGGVSPVQEMHTIATELNWL